MAAHPTPPERLASIHAVPETYGNSISLTKKSGTPSEPSTFVVPAARPDMHVRERVLAEQVLRLRRELDEERVHHDDGRLALEERLEREEAVRGILERLHAPHEVEPAVLERVRELVGEESVLEQRPGGEAERGRRRGGLRRPLGNDEEFLDLRVVEARDLARVQLRELLLEARLGVEEPDGGERGRVAREGGREVLDEFLPQDLRQILFGKDGRRHGTAERDAPDRLDEFLGLGDRLGEPLRERRERRGRGGREGGGGERRECEEPGRLPRARHFPGRDRALYHARGFCDWER